MEMSQRDLSQQDMRLESGLAFASGGCQMPVGLAEVPIVMSSENHAGQIVRLLWLGRLRKRPTSQAQSPGYD